MGLCQKKENNLCKRERQKFSSKEKSPFIVIPASAYLAANTDFQSVEHQALHQTLQDILLYPNDPEREEKMEHTIDFIKKEGISTEEMPQITEQATLTNDDILTLLKRSKELWVSQRMAPHTEPPTPEISEP